MVFVERKQPQSIFSWLVILTVIPIGGFFLYMLFGGGLSIRTRLLIRRTKRYTTDYYKFISWQKINFNKLREQNEKFDYAYELVDFVKNCDECTFSTGNKVELFLDGLEKIEQLKQDLLQAQHSINIEYYIFDDDKIGCEIMNILCQKAKSGVKVKLIFDSIGSLRAPRRFFKKLKKCGGEVAEFFPPFMGIRLINLKINYRNHRKIVVIDNNNLLCSFYDSESNFDKLVEQAKSNNLYKAELKQHIANNRLHVVGGWYVQPDCNLASAETYRRHAEIGCQYFKEKFGRNYRLASEKFQKTHKKIPVAFATGLFCA